MKQKREGVNDPVDLLPSRFRFSGKRAHAAQSLQSGNVRSPVSLSVFRSGMAGSPALDSNMTAMVQGTSPKSDFQYIRIGRDGKNIRQNRAENDKNVIILRVLQNA